MFSYVEKGEILILIVRVVPRASKSEVIGIYDGALKVRIASPPVDGAANEELIKLLSKTFGVSKNRIEISSGFASKIKQIKISGMRADDVQRVVALNLQ